MTAARTADPYYRKPALCESCHATPPDPDKPYARYCVVCRHAAQCKRGKYRATPAIDAIIADAWRSAALGSRAYRVVQARGVKWPKWKICRRAADLGLTRDRRPRGHNPWSPAELEILERFQHLAAAGARAKLKAAGFDRTLESIRLQRKRSGLTVSRSETATLGQIADICGVDRSTATRWAERHGLRTFLRHSAKAGDIRAVRYADFRRWVFANPAIVDLRKVADQEMFLWLLEGGV